MPDSGPAEPSGSAGGADLPPRGESGPQAHPAETLAALEEAVGRLLEAYGDLRERVDRAEGTRRDLAEALAGAGPEELTPEEAERRFRELAEENRRLREVVEEGRERAERIRSRLIMMEDEL